VGVSIYDYDTVGDNDFIGSVEIPFTDIFRPDQPAFNSWVTVRYNDKDGVSRPAGDIEYRVHYYPREGMPTRSSTFSCKSLTPPRRST